jgi:lipid-binding SYLF domain-containing protein
MRSPFALCLLGVVALTVGCASAPGDTADEKRQYIDQQAASTLQMVMADKDLDAEKIDAAVGYAAITNIGTKVLLIGADDGYGVLVNNRTGERTYLDISGIDFGPGVGVTKYRTLMLFETEEALNKFKDGQWEFGASVAATAKTEDAGGSAEDAASFNKDVDVYISGEKGLAASAQIRSLNVAVNPQLNAKN